jgi:ABC-type sugar transport system substrate-binding protein
MNIISKRRSALGTLAVIAVGAAVVGCGGGSGDGDAGAASGGKSAPKVAGATFGFAYGMESSPVYNTVLKPAKAEAARQHIKLLEGSANGKCDAQLHDLDNMIQSGVKAITFLGLCGAGAAYDRPIASARRKGITMVSYAFAHPKADGSITFDDKQAGELTAADASRWLRSTFKGDYASFKWALMPCSGAPPIVQQRIKVVRKVIVALTGVKPFDDKDCALDPQAGQQATKSWLQKAPKLNMVIGINDAGALGAYQALKQSTTVDRSRLYVAGMDGQREAVQLLARGGDGIYHFTAAVPICSVGHQIVQVPAGIVRGSTDASSVVMKYVPLSAANRSGVRAFYDQQFLNCR